MSDLKMPGEEDGVQGDDHLPPDHAPVIEDSTAPAEPMRTPPAPD